MEIRKTPDRKVLGEVGNLRLEPMSPTANLRLLTNLASSLKSSPMKIDRSNDVTLGGDSTQLTETPNRLSLQPRKEKSLKLLCNKFFKLYPLIPSNDSCKTISLNETAILLGTKKRRIYDIINILESLEMASKTGKNQYLWHGQTFLPLTLAKLKSLAIEIGVEQYIQNIQSIDQSYVMNLSDSHHSSESTTPNDGSVDSFVHKDLKNDKSLGIMCQKFLMLFLTSLKNCVVNLDIAVNYLLLESEQKKQDNLNIKTTIIRRLYDIANVLTAIGLIKKVNLKNSILKKPIYVFMGPDVDDIDPSTVPEPVSHDNNRHTLIGMSTPKTKFQNFVEQKMLKNDKDTPITQGTSNDTTNSSSKKLISRKRKLFSSGKKINKIDIKNSPSLIIPKELKNDDSESGARKKLFPSLHLNCDSDDVRYLNTGSSLTDTGEVNVFQLKSDHWIGIDNSSEPIQLIDYSNSEESREIQAVDDIPQNHGALVINKEKQTSRRCDKLKIPLAPNQQVLIKNGSSSETCFLILPDVSNKIYFSTDKFKAEVIENVVQLVPLNDT